MTKNEGICLALGCRSFQTADQLPCDPSRQRRSFKVAKQGCFVARGLSCGICAQTSLRLPSGTLGGLHQGCASCTNISRGAAEAEVLYYYFVSVNLFIWHVHTALFIIFGWAGSWLLHAGFFSSCGDQGLPSSCRAWASHCGGFSCGRAQALGAWTSGVAAQALICGSWDLSMQAQ